MKLQLLHGPAITSSRKKLLEIKGKFDSENIIIFEKGSDTSQIMDSLGTTPLFGEEQLAIFENPSEELTAKLLTINYKLLTIILWFDKEIDVKKFPGAEVSVFPESQEVSVFPFLRLLGGKDPKAFLELEKLKRAGFDSQYFITMILYLLRNLVSTPKKAVEFVRNNNEKMRKNFTRRELLNLYKNILEIDFKIKKGLLETEQAEHLLVSRFLN